MTDDKYVPSKKVEEMLEHFNTERPLYLLGSAVTQFTGMDLERIASWLRKMNKHTMKIY